MGMAVSMAAMMLPTAVPFFVALRRPARIAVAGGIYVAAWALIGAVANLAMMANLTLPYYIGAIAIAFAVLYLVSPWARAARARCQELCIGTSNDPWRAGLAYTGNCVLCSAGVMAALMVLGATNVAVLAAGAAVLLFYKAPISVA